jgi:Ferritin-like domain
MNPKGHTPVDLETADRASSRRSMIGAIGAAGAIAAFGALATARPAAASAPFTLTSADRDRLNVLMRFELTARDLYQASLDAGLDGVAGEFATTLIANHAAYAQAIGGAAGISARLRSTVLFDQFEAPFATSDISAWATAAYQLESTFVATHTAAIGQFESIQAVNLIASIVAVEARQSMVIADIGEFPRDASTLNAVDAEALSLVLTGVDATATADEDTAQSDTTEPTTTEEEGE